MYLHIGKNCVIKDNKVIGIFNIEKIKDTPEYKKMYEKLDSENRLEDLSCNQKNSFIITSDKKDDIRGFISNIGTNTMRKQRMII